MQWLKVQVLNSTYALQSGHTYSVLLIQTLYIQLRYIIIKAADRRINFIIKSVLNIRNRAKLGVEQKRGHFEHLIYCYQMKFPDKLRINLPWFFLYTRYTCHNRWSKYNHLPWNTLYAHICLEGRINSKKCSIYQIGIFGIFTILQLQRITETWKLSNISKLSSQTLHFSKKGVQKIYFYLVKMAFLWVKLFFRKWW